MAESGILWIRIRIRVQMKQISVQQILIWKDIDKFIAYMQVLQYTHVKKQ